MNRQSLLQVVLAISGLLCASVYAAPQSKSNDAPKISEEHRVALIRGVQAEHCFAKVIFPQGKKGLTFKDGKITPGAMEVNQVAVREGAAAQVGDRMLITDLLFEGNKIVLELNGGPRKGVKWYQRISIGGNGGETPVSNPDPRAVNSQGSVLTVVFKDHIPDMTPEQFKQLLSPIFDFTSLTVAEAYAKQLPPKVALAIKNHQVLVGMDRDMVEYSLGRPPKRYRDKDDKGRDYEEWIYGTPPEDVEFVRFIGPTVTMLTIMKVDGEKVVKTDPEVVLASKETEAKPDEGNAPKKQTKRPSLLAPGEQNPDAPAVSNGQTQEPTHAGSPGGAPTTSPTSRPTDPKLPPDATPPPQFASSAH
ncbi:MAG TPA: hypothetical protein VGL89_06960 [Candidatus Koribacter sp.]|jgi:hypothetical protein